MNTRVYALVLLLCFALSMNAIAQTSNASLGGTVGDPSAAVIPGVEVTATNVGTGVVNRTLSNEAGAYSFPSLQTGTYEVRAALTGFQTQTYNSVTLGVSQQVRLNFIMKLGGITQSVDVVCRPIRCLLRHRLRSETFLPTA
jgi:hypothetical protein